MKPAELKSAMETVVSAHRVLLRFHREIVAMWRIVDEQFAEYDTPNRLVCENPDDYVRYTPDKVSTPQDWVPKWLGRFYFVAGKPDRMAFIWIAVATDDDMAASSGPECVLGIAFSGTEMKADSGWKSARYGVWESLETEAIPGSGWGKGTLKKKPSLLGDGAFWHATRVPLSELVDTGAIAKLVTAPLQSKYDELFPPE